VSDPNDGGR
jgi:uncharacterized protein (TIGR02271 family)